jgi:glycosyl transferase family 25
MSRPPCVLVINLDRSPQRLANMGARLAGWPWPWERLPAVDGSALAGWPAAEVDEATYRRRHGRELPRGEVGCYLSHLRAMRRFLESGRDHLVLLEDDAVPGPDFVTVVERLLERAGDWDLVKLSGFHRCGPWSVASLTAQHRLAIPFARQGNTAALLMSRAAASRLLDALQPMSLPYDHALERPWTCDVRLRVVVPPPCAAGDDTGTTVAMHSTRKLEGVNRLSTHAFRLRNELARLAWACGQAWRQVLSPAGRN